jgi:hypothetical protein
MKPRIVLQLTIMLLISLSMLPCVLAQPQPPCVFYGSVLVGGTPAPDGLNVTAVIAGTTLEWMTQTVNGTYGWQTRGSSLFMIPSDNADSSVKDGGTAGDIILFYVNGTKADQTAIFESASAEQVDLSVQASVSTGTLEQSYITAALDCLTTYSGYKVSISGELTYADGVGIPGADLIANFSINNGQMYDITSFNTTNNGNYIVEWTPDTSGNYLVKVDWAGNENVEGAETYVNLAATQFEQKYVFSVISNSTISGLVFNSTSRVLSFILDDPSGTGYANATIAKDLISDPNGVKMYLDGIQTDYTTMSSESSWLLHFTYEQSTHEIDIDLGQSTQPFLGTPLGIATLFGIVAILIAIIFIGHNRLTRPKKTKRTKSNSKSQKPSARSA